MSLIDRVRAEAEKRGVPVDDVLKEIRQEASPKPVFRHVKIPADLAADIDAEAEAKGVSASEVIRARVAAGPRFRQAPGAPVKRVKNARG